MSEAQNNNQTCVPSESEKGHEKGHGKEKGKVKEKESNIKIPDTLPEYVAHRIAVWDRCKASYLAEVAKKRAEQKPIHVAVSILEKAKGKEKGAADVLQEVAKPFDGIAWQTTPAEIATAVKNKNFMESVVVAQVDGNVWDLDRPLESDCKLKFLIFEDKDGEYVFRHSSAHIVGEAMEKVYGGLLCYGPPVEEGFYYDMYIPPTAPQQVSGSDLPVLEEVSKSIIQEKQPFERLEMSKEDLLEMFKYNEFKCRIIRERITTPSTTVYRCGPLIDLCTGPHVRHTGKVKALAVTKNSSAYWEGRADAETLQRVYGISFPDEKQLKEWKTLQEEAAKRDHRKLGREHELFFFHEWAPGSCFWYPAGAHIYNKLVDFIRSEYRKRGYSEVITPNIFNRKLWETSGHWANYQENMYHIEIEKEMFSLKPMNCPSHCLMFGSRSRSHRELPIRMADFGVLHRNELSGTLSGLTRVRRFQQDDTHIFCRPDQIKQEIEGVFDFMKNVYTVLGFEFQLALSTRPEKFMGDIELWNNAEKVLTDCLNESFGSKWVLNPGDGAFYGPKIDLRVTDAMKRLHQCATVQLDFQLPIRFNLSYVTGEVDPVTNEAKKERPVIIHRALLGSVERMMGVLTEHFAAKWPFWLSPRQVRILTVSSKFDEYATSVQKRIFEAGIESAMELDPGETLNKKIRNAQLEQVNFILVVGEKEQANGTVNVRTRDNKVHGEFSVEQVIKRFKELVESRELRAEEKFGDGLQKPAAAAQP